ncbi:glutathione s- [Stylonychia lemnae]|uniref:Glutathione s n=1 Tax=Stylonychia lemnae TaxID=5949 RepID=A0A078B5J1_STYLE|nr:glutathione s- [Stylonychia lemnae]|eukprot:CDW89684.1 glutathione s- [Stylonychia lemnae]
MKLYYFNAYGRAEPLRMLLNHAKVSYEDIRIDKPEWNRYKRELQLEFKQVPAIEIEGKLYTQANSILRLLGSKYGYYPKDPYESYQVDSLVDALKDLYGYYSQTAFEIDLYKQKLKLGIFISEQLPRYFQILENRLMKNNSQLHIVGNQFTIADFALIGIIFTIVYNDAYDDSFMIRQIFERYPLLRDYAYNIRNNVFKDYLNQRPISSQ